MNNAGLSYATTPHLSMVEKRRMEDGKKNTRQI